MALPRFDRGGTWYPEPLHEADRRTELRRQELQEVLEADIRWLVKQVPQVDASGEVRIGEPARVLRDAASGAQLTVVGSRGRGAVASTLLGSTSREVLHEVDGPVMVVPYLDDDRVDAEEEVTAAADESGGAPAASVPRRRRWRSCGSPPRRCPRRAGPAAPWWSTPGCPGSGTAPWSTAADRTSASGAG